MTDKLTADQWRQLLSRESVVFDVISNSMKPRIIAGDKVVISPLTEDPQPGTVIAYHVRQGPAPLIIHRYLGGERFKADHKLFADPAVKKNQWVGIVDTVIRDGSERALKVELPEHSLLQTITMSLHSLLAYIRKKVSSLIGK